MGNCGCCSAPEKTSGDGFWCYFQEDSLDDPVQKLFIGETRTQVDKKFYNKDFVKKDLRVVIHVENSRPPNFVYNDGNPNNNIGVEEKPVSATACQFSLKTLKLEFFNAIYKELCSEFGVSNVHITKEDDAASMLREETDNSNNGNNNEN